MSCGEPVGIHRPRGEFRQQAELQMPVADHAGIRRVSRRPFPPKPLNDPILIRLRTVEDTIVNAEPFGELFGNRDIRRLTGTETGVAGAAPITALAPQFHRYADHLMTVPLQQQGGHGGIDTARKADRDSHFRLLSREYPYLPVLCLSFSDPLMRPSTPDAR